ncbi:MarR family winged helix-turn-helix transcriptional regulator [Niallia sp. FSL R7-0271]|uniref:MarR family winged helix-turn-helix transcriptional regulator n=1 Tax=Niallia sp. FSL R7-0271 TaxID=2921678 RepID=UPI0030FBD26B
MKNYRFEESLGHKIEICSRLMSAQLNQRFKNSNYPVTSEQWGVINVLLDKDGISQNQLANELQKNHTSISRLIDNLIKKGLIRRINDPNDGRTNLICLTKKGRELQLGVKQQVQNHLENVLDGIETNDIIICTKVLDNIISNLK